MICCHGVIEGVDQGDLLPKLSCAELKSLKWGSFGMADSIRASRMEASSGRRAGSVMASD